MKTKGRYLTTLSIGVAAVWFSTHCGPGFASGTQEVAYFVKFGWTAIFLPIVSMALVGILGYISMEFARLSNNYSYRNVADLAMRPFSKVYGPLYDIIVLAMFVIGVSACIAGGATLGNQTLGIPLFLGTVIMVVITLVIDMYGVEIVRKNGILMTVGIIICILIIFVLGIKRGWARAGEIIVNKEMYVGYWPALMGAFIYAGFQSAGNPAVMVAASIGAQSSKENKGATIFGIILNSVMLGGMCLMLMGFMPTVVADKKAATLPTLYAVGQLGANWLKVVYPVLLILALVTSAVGMSYAFVERVKPYVLKKYDNEKMKNFIIALAFILLCLLISQVGFLKIVLVGYKYMGYIGIFGLIIPFLTLGFYNLHKYKKEHEGEMVIVKEEITDESK